MKLRRKTIISNEGVKMRIEVEALLKRIWIELR